MAEDINGALGIRATIDADDIKTSSQQWVETITGMQSKTNEVVQGMNDSLSSLQKQVDEFGRTANGMSLSELSSQLNNSKAAFVSLGGDIRQQKYIIKETIADLGDLQRAYKRAKDEGNTRAADDLSKQIDNYKEGLAAQRRELNSMVAQQQAEKEKITELTQAYKELQSSQPTFDNVVNGAGTATERVQALKQSFAEFQNTLQNSQNAINGLSDESAKSTISGNQTVQEINKIVTTRYVAEGAEEVQAKNEQVEKGLKDIGASYAAAAATAQTAFSEQKNVIQALEGQIQNLNSIMQQAVKNGDMSSATEAAEQIKILEAQLTSAKEKLSELKEQASVANENLQDFGNLSSEIAQRVENQNTAWGRLKDRIKSVGLELRDFANDQGKKANTVLSSFKDTIDGMGLPMTKTISNFGKMTKAAIAFVTTPLGIVLGTIALALKAVHTWLHKSAEGQKVMASMSAYFGSIMSSITDIVIAFGNYLYKTFSGSNKAVNQFATNFVSAFKNAFHAVKDLAVGFGTIFKGVWQVLNGDLSKGWESMKEGVAQMGSGFSSAVRAISDTIKAQISGMKAGASVVYGMFQDKDLNNSLSKSFGNMFSNAKEASDRALKALQLSKETDQAKMRSLALDEQIAKGKEKIYTLTGKAKDEEIKRVKALEKEKYYGRDVIDQKTKQKRHEDGILDVQRKQYENLKATNALHTQTLGTLKAERQAHIGILQTEARAAASTRMLTRMEAANQRKMASQAKTAAKSALNKSNAVTSAQGKINDVYMANADTRATEAIKMEKAVEKARIGAMSDGYARTKAEREAQNKDELNAIVQQQEAAIKAEKKRQKAEFEAEQALVKANGGKIQKWDETKIDKSEIDKINALYEQLFNFTEQSQTRKTNDELAAEYDKQQTERKQKINKLKADIAELEEQLQKVTNESKKAELKKLKDNAQAQLDWVSQSKDAWNEYYEKYGTFLEKRAALEEKFLHDTQGLDKKSPEYKLKYEEYKQNKSSLRTSELKSNVDWSSVFSDIGMMSSKMARMQLANLQDYTQTDEYKGLNANDKKTISDAIDNLLKNAGPTIIGSFKNFGKAVDRYKVELQKLSTLQDNEMQAQNALLEAKNLEAQRAKEVADAQEKLKKTTETGNNDNIQAARKNLEAAKKNLESAQAHSIKTKKAADDASRTVKEQTSATEKSKNDVKRQGQNLTSSFNTITSVFQNLKSGSLSGTFNSIVDIVNAFKDVKDASNEASDASKKSSKQQEKDAQSNSISAGKTEQAQEKTNEAIGAIGQAMQAVPNVWVKAIGAVLSVLDILGDDLEGGIGNLVGTLFEKVGSIIETLLSQIGSGKFFADIGKGVWNLVGGIGRGLGDAFGMRDNWNSYRKASEQYEKLDKVWTSLISKKKEYLSLSYGEEAKKVGEEYVKLAKANLDATKLISNQYLGAWKKGSHSAGYKFDKRMSDGVKGMTWSDITSATGIQISSISELTNLSYKQLEKLKTEYTEWWVELPEKYREYLESIIEKQGTLEDAQEELKEKLTGIKFDDMYSNFMSALSDMSKGADDFVQDFKNNMLKALIENTMGDEVKEWMDDYVKRYQAAVKLDGGKISETEAQKFRQELSEASNKFFNERQQIANSIGQGSAASSGEQKQGFATASEDSIEELSGRALAQTEALYQIRDQQLLDASTITSIDNNLMQIVVIENKRNAYYDETLELHRNSVSHLAAIERNTNELYSMNEKLTKIERNTRNI